MDIITKQEENAHESDHRRTANEWTLSSAGADHQEQTTPDDVDGDTGSVAGLRRKQKIYFAFGKWRSSAHNGQLKLRLAAQKELFENGRRHDQALCLKMGYKLKELRSALECQDVSDPDLLAEVASSRRRCDELERRLDAEEKRGDRLRVERNNLANENKTYRDENAQLHHRLSMERWRAKQQGRSASSILSTAGSSSQPDFKIGRSPTPFHLRKPVVKPAQSQDTDHLFANLFDTDLNEDDEKPFELLKWIFNKNKAAKLPPPKSPPPPPPGPPVPECQDWMDQPGTSATSSSSSRNNRDGALSFGPWPKGNNRNVAFGQAVPDNGISGAAGTSSGLSVRGSSQMPLKKIRRTVDSAMEKDEKEVVAAADLINLFSEEKIDNREAIENDNNLRISSSADAAALSSSTKDDTSAERHRDR